jgi:hypothetical protein
VGAALGLLIANYASVAAAAPDFVHAIVAVQAVLMASFGAVGTWAVATSAPRPFETAEWAFPLLSFASKFVPSVVFLSAILQA